MPIDYPSQAQVGLGKGLEGLFKGIQSGMEGQEKIAYLQALQRLKGEQELAKAATPRLTYKHTDVTGMPSGKGSAPKILPSANASDYDKIIRSTIAGVTGQSLSDDFNPYTYDPSALTPEQAQKANASIANQVIALREQFNRRSAGQPNFVPYDLNPPSYFIEGEEKTIPGGWFSEDTKAKTYKVNPAWKSWIAGQKPKRSGLVELVKKAQAQGKK